MNCDRKTRVFAGLILVSTIGCTGNTEEVQPKDPALVALSPFIGEWTMRGTVKIPGNQESAELRGSNTAFWNSDGTILLAKGWSSVADGDPSKALAAWTYDSENKIYRTAFANNRGSVGNGTAWFDESDSRWQARTTADGPSGRIRFEGWIRFDARGAKQEHWVGTDETGAAIFELDKTEHRKP